MCCCVRQFCDEITEGIDTRKLKANYIYNYIKKLPHKLFRLNKLEDISDICCAAREGKALTTHEKAVLIMNCLEYINENN